MLRVFSYCMDITSAERERKIDGEREFRDTHACTGNEVVENERPCYVHLHVQKNIIMSKGSCHRCASVLKYIHKQLRGLERIEKKRERKKSGLCPTGFTVNSMQTKRKGDICRN